MKTLNQAILDIFEITEQDASLSVKDLVLMEDATATCVKVKNRFVVTSKDKTVYGRGKTEEAAWTKAALDIQGFKVQEQ